MSEGERRDVDVDDISPLAWRLLRTAAGYERRALERELDDEQVRVLVEYF